MALQGVLTGIMKPRLAANVAARAGTSGSPPVATPKAIATGTTMFALAVLLVNSLVRTATPAARTTRTTGPAGPLGTKPWIDSPTAVASPVEKQRVPRAMPPP